ncbi:AAA family ATPase [Sphingomonas sp. 10B4]|uniref:AAA family ATPase n=1 Tax=Sphingomonas sp. 10B4 TaxID=3048575 RepID=UPI002AB50DBE|nr:AAA family ATPase [Sphingomonas sp. 10B4]MDY7524258.1 AAA family ATPase [Sphingomonas sp. 10B4]MEB0283796.1 AAA family ATPase [Sphingomonas sp. 10B4]
MSYTVNTLRNMTRSCEQMRDRVKAIVFKPGDRKVLDITFGPTAAAELIGRTPEALAKAEKEGRLPPPKQLGNGRRYYTLQDLTQIREALHINVGKASDEDAVVVAVQNFKGGVGKSTITKHFADFLALNGYRVLVIDCDPQASTTTMFDIQPESLLDEEETLGNFLSPRSTFDDFRKAIHDTAWPTIKIVPSSLGLQDAEWDLTATLREGGQAVREGLQRLRFGIESVLKDFDVILLDPPPAMGFLGLNVMAAATGLLVPVPARQLDYLSTIHFMDTIADNIEILEENGTPVDYGFIRIVCSAYTPSKPGENDMWKMMQSTYANFLLSQPILASEEIKNATQAFRSVYESKPSAAHATYQRCRDNLDSVFNEVLQQIRAQWPSKSMSGRASDTSASVAA